MSVAKKIVSKRTHLSDKGREIADWIIENSEQVSQLTSTQLASQLGISQSYIVKFSQHLGYKGYSDLKLALREDIGRINAEKSVPLHSDILADDPLAVISQKLVKAKTDALFNTTNALSFDHCQQAVKWLSEARKVQIVGIGGSALTAKDLGFKLLKLGITALTEQDSHVQIAVARTLSEEDVQIAISYSGKRKEILIAAEAAKEQGAKLISLTSLKKSPLREISDLIFTTIADEAEHRSSSIASRTAQNVITDLLFIILVQQRDKDARQLISDISSDIKQMF